MDWLVISCVASGAIGLTLGGVLIAFWFADKADDLMDYAERQLVEDDGCAWPIQAERDRANLHNVTDLTR